MMGFLSVYKSVYRSLLVMFLVALISACGNDKPVEITKGLQNKPGPVNVFRAPPSFGETSQDAVKLEHKFVPGEVVKGKQTMYVLNSERVAQTAAKYSTRKSTIDFQYKVVKVFKDNSANIEIQILRVRLQDRGKSTQDFDSDSKNSEKAPLFTLYKALIKTPIRFRVTATGKTSDIDISAVRNKLTSITNAKLKDYLVKIATDVAKEGFINLPEKPIKPGQSFSPDVLKARMGKLGVLNTKSKYVVKAVSSDKTRVLLERQMEYTFVADKHNPVKTTLAKSSANSWVLFDLAKGKVLSGSSEIQWGLVASIAKSSLHVSTNTQTYYSKTSVTETDKSKPVKKAAIDIK